MEKELLRFIEENNLSPFSRAKTQIKSREGSIFRTKDAKTVFNKTLAKISSGFCFAETSNLWSFFSFTQDVEEIKKRQEFFKSIKSADSSFLKELKTPKNWWKPKYGILVVTEDEKSYLELQKLNCPVQFINSRDDISGLEDYDIVQVVDCPDSSTILEALPQSLLLDSADEAYLERFLEFLSGWKENLEILEKNKTNEEIESIIKGLLPLLELLKDKPSEHLSREEVESGLEKINTKIEDEISKLNISGTSLLSILSKGKLPPELEKIREKAVSESGIQENLFTTLIPVAVDESELGRFLKKQDAYEFSAIAEKIKKKAAEIQKIPEKLSRLSDLLILLDFESAISKMTENTIFPEYSNELVFSDSENLFLEKAQPISFYLGSDNRCSILTGANSGGKTTLLEHVIQLITLFQLGLPVNGKVKMPIFSEVYYFAKSKGASSKGAFENLLTQMDDIEAGDKTLILADEIESVTEPGVAGRIIAATAEFFLQKGCFLVIATHLGQEIQKNLPSHSRIDGIEAHGLDEYFELIVDHNPVLGRLASSTPELIVDKLASLQKTEYFKFLQEKIKRN
jgi:hypothetical protein